MSQVADNLADAKAAEPAAPAPQPPIAPAVGRKAAVGFIWTTAQSVASKGVSLVSQIVLARILAKEDFGVVGLALTVATFARLLQTGGLDAVLVQRGASFRRWATAAFWISAALGILTALLMVAGAPLAARLYHDPTSVHGGGVLADLILILAIAAPFDAITSVPASLLQVRLQFRALAVIEFSRILLTAGLSILLALRHYGAASFIIPVTVVSVVRCAVLWAMARPQVRLRFHWRRWRSLFSDSRLTFGTSVFGTLLSQGDYVALGIFRSKEVVGLYYFSFILSAQAMQLFVGNFAQVLFPVLTTLRGERQRQVQAYLESTKLFAVLAFPACFLQAALGGPILRILFGDKWASAVPVFQVLSLAMVSFVVSHPAWAILQAQGRFKTLFRFSAARTIAFMIAVIVAANVGEALSVAVAVLVVLSIFGPLAVYLSLRDGGPSWGVVVRIYLAPMIAAAATVGLAYFIAQAVPLLRHNDWLNGGFVAVAGSVLYLAAIRVAAPRQMATVMARIRAWVRAGG